MFDWVIGLRKYWNFQSEVKVEQIIATVTTWSVSCYSLQYINFTIYLIYFVKRILCNGLTKLICISTKCYGFSMDIYKIYIKLNNETFKTQLYFDSYKSSTYWQWNKTCKNYIQLYQLKKIKRAKSRLKIKIKML